MRATALLVFCILLFPGVQAQKVERFVFNLYTDSLKRGFYNYINVDGQLSDGGWRPLDSVHLELSSNAGPFRGNDLFIDSSYKGDSVVVTAALRSHPALRKEIVIWIRKRPFDALPSERDVMNGAPAGDSRKKKKA